MISRVLQSLCSGHTQINQVVAGDPFQLNELSDVKYPVAIYDIINSNIATSTRSTTYRLYLADRVVADNSNILEIQEDMFNIISDIVKQIAYDYEYTISDRVVATPFVQKFVDDTSGYFADFEIVEPYATNYCENPLVLGGGGKVIEGDDKRTMLIDIINKNIEQDARLDVIENESTIPVHNDYYSNFLQSENSGGTLNNDVYNFWNFTPKSIYNALNKILTYIFNRKDEDLFYFRRLNEPFNNIIKLDRDVTQYQSYTLTGNTELSIDSSAVVEGTAEGVLIGNGNSLLTLSGINYWATSPEFDKTLNKQNHYMIWKQGDGVYIFITQKN